MKDNQDIVSLLFSFVLLTAQQTFRQQSPHIDPLLFSFVLLTAQQTLVRGKASPHITKHDTSFSLTMMKCKKNYIINLEDNLKRY